MASPNLTVRGAYSLGSSIGKNHISTHDFGTPEESDIRPVYICPLSVSAETKYEQGNTGVFQLDSRPVVRIDLVGADGNAYKEAMWTGAEYEAAIEAAVTSAEVYIKTNYGTGL
tara:strand:+ start:188 stop:529 length:342 start_codon:yes stop_codon:yes gene_type:complete